jgi:hypothetical protein
VDKRRTQNDGLLVPDVAVEIDVAAKPVVLTLINGRIRDGGIYEFPQNTDAQRKEATLGEKRLTSRNWRSLRNELLSLNMQARDQIAKWLTSAGYAPDHIHHEWNAGNVSDELASSLLQDREIVAWLMGLEVEAFRKAVKAAHEYFEDLRDIQAHRVNESYAHTKVRVVNSHISTVRTTYKKQTFRDPKVDFLQSAKVPEGADFDPLLLCQYLMGTGIASLLRASFMWEKDGSPKVRATVGTPLEAIALSVHVDRNFSVRQWTICANERCKHGFERDRGIGRFCSKRCKNYVLTTRRRAKKRLVVDGQAAWETLGQTKQPGRKRWEWIADWATKKSGGKFEVDAAWAKQELTKAR